MVKKTDLQRLRDKYMMVGDALINLEKQIYFLGADEIKLHSGYKYTSFIIDTESKYSSSSA